MKVEVTIGVKLPHESEGYGSRSSEEELFVVIIRGNSTKVVEEKVGKLQEAMTHMGWKLGDPDRDRGY